MSVVTGNPELDFFEQNPALKVKQEFKDLIKQYPSNASKIAWAVWFIEDNTKSNPLRNMSREDRIEETKQNYYDIDLDEHKNLMKAYATLCMSREETMYKITLEKLDEVTSFLREQMLDDETQFNKAIKILSNMGKMWDSLSKAYGKLVESESKSTLRGNITESYRERKSKD
jgi:hypothetical protein